MGGHLGVTVQRQDQFPCMALYNCLMVLAEVSQLRANNGQSLFHNETAKKRGYCQEEAICSMARRRSLPATGWTQTNQRMKSRELSLSQKQLLLSIQQSENYFPYS